MASPRNDNVKELILSATESLMESQKLSVISLAKIACAAGISKGTLYYYYKTKNSIERAYTTIKTVMDRLVSKDLLVRYKSGKKFFYRSTLDRYEIARDTIREVASQFFNGNQIEMLRFIENECVNIPV